MKSRDNCWDFMRCGKGPSESRKEKSDVCPVAVENDANGLNGGVNGGRICWIISKNGCGGHVKCSDACSEDSCFQCEFRYRVMQEEGLLQTCHATGILLSKRKTAVPVSPGRS